MRLLLSEEYDHLQVRINELEGVQKQHAIDMKEALSQSSETWHDNAPRDAILESANVTSKSLENLTKMFNEALVSIIEPDEFIVGLGTKFVLGGDDGEKLEFQMTGSQNLLEVENGLPYDSPLGKIVFKKEFYDHIEFKGKGYTITPA